MPPSSARRSYLLAPRLAASATRSDRDLLCFDSRPMGLFVYGSLFESVPGVWEQCHTNLGGFYLSKSVTGQRLNCSI